MKMLMAACGLAAVLAGPAWGQDRTQSDFAVIEQRYFEAIQLAYTWSAALECGLRQPQWMIDVAGIVVRQNQEVAASAPRAFIGGAPVASAFLSGAVSAAQYLAKAEAQHGALCPRVRDGATLRYLDTLVRP